MTRINHLGASRRLTPRITLMASSTKYKFKEERKRILKLSVKKLRSIEDPEAFLSKSVLINNTLKRLQTEVREEKAERKKAENLSYSPSPYSFYSVEKAYREEMERLDNNGKDSNTSSLANPAAISDAPYDRQYKNDAMEDHEMYEADHETEDDDRTSTASSSSESSSSEDEDLTEDHAIKDDTKNVSDHIEVNDTLTSSEVSSVEDDLLSEVYMPTPSMPPPPQLIGGIDDDLPPLRGPLGGDSDRPSTPVPWGASKSNLHNSNNPSAEAVIKSSEANCDSEDSLWSEAVRTECWTKPAEQQLTSVSVRTTLTDSSTVNTNTWPSVDWPTYTPSAASSAGSSSPTSTAASMASNNAAASNFNPNISALPAASCTSHKENYYMPVTGSASASTASNLSDKCYSCGQSSLFQSELQSVVFNSLIASLET